MAALPLSDEIGDQLAGWGKALIVETSGRATGRPARAAVGFVEEADGSYLVAAGDPDANWALNLLATPDCTITISGTTTRAVAEPLDGVAFQGAIRELILKYGTSSERLGLGPAFRLRPVAEEGG